MTICRFYLQGRCRFGDKCRYEHSDPNPVYQGKENYSWVAPSYNSHGNYSQSPLSRNSSNQNSYAQPEPRYGNDNQYDYSSSTSIIYQNSDRDRYRWKARQNQYQDSNIRSGGPSNNTFQQKSSTNASDRKQQEQDSSIISIIKEDINTWENTDIWPFSCYSHFQEPGACLPGFVDMSPEELRYQAYESHKNDTFAFYTETIAMALNEIKKKWAVLKNPTSDVLQSLIKGYHTTSNFCEKNLKKLIPGGEIGGMAFNGEQMTQTAFPPTATQATSPAGFSFKLAHLDSSKLPSNSLPFKSVLPTNKTVISLPSFGTSGGFGSPSNSGFGSTAPTSVFGSSVQSSVFGSSSVSSGFGASIPTTAIVSSTTSVPSMFGSSDLQSSRPKSAVNQDIKSCAYTELDSLTEAEKNQFNSQTFTLGKIPLHPPPMELCF